MNPITLENCIWLGGAGYPVDPGVQCHVSFSQDGLTVRTLRNRAFEVPLLEVCSIEISGPGTVAAGGGFVGGGFGVEGAVEGIAVATLLNAITTKSKIHTFVFVTTNIGEFHLHFSGMEPSALRIALANTFTALRRLEPSWQKRRVAILEAERNAKQISDEEFERLKTRLTLPLTDLLLESASDETQKASDSSLGTCPSCRSTIPLNSKECSKCRAIFSADSSWNVIPI